MLLLVAMLESALRLLEECWWTQWWLLAQKLFLEEQLAEEMRAKSTQRNNNCAVLNACAFASHIAYRTTEDNGNRASNVKGDNTFVSCIKEELVRLMCNTFADMEGIPSMAPQFLLTLLAICSVFLWLVLETSRRTARRQNSFDAT